MQVTQTHDEGLKREFKVVVSATDIKSKMDTRLQEIGQTVRLPGFRPGKVPMPLLKKRYGASVMGEVLERAVTDFLATRRSRNAACARHCSPRSTSSPSPKATGLEYSLAVEVLPEIQPANFAEVELERMKVDVPDTEVDKTLSRLAEQHERSEKTDEDRPSQAGDVVVIDFVGTLDGKEFQGGIGQGFPARAGLGSVRARLRGPDRPAPRPATSGRST